MILSYILIFLLRGDYGLGYCLKLSPIIITTIYLIIVTSKSIIWGKDLSTNTNSKPYLMNSAWCILLIITIVCIISSIIKYNSIIEHTLYFIIILFLCELKIYEINTKFKITNKGFIYHTLFFTWDNIINFNWKENLLELITVKHKKIKINVPFEKKNTVNSLLIIRINNEL